MPTPGTDPGAPARASRPARRLRRAAPLALVLLAGSGALGAQTLQAGPPSAPVLAVLERDVARVELEGRRLVDVALGRGAELSSLVAAGDRWLLAGSRLAVDGRRRLAIVAGDDLGWREIPSPPGLNSRARSGAVLLGDPDGLDLRGELVVAWLEGDGTQRQSVRAARYQDGAFGEPELVAAPGPGSQVALRGAVLTDGTPLLVWNAFDGTDNEIVWSWSRGGVWSPPQRIGGDNAVPDVSPQVAAQGTGAVVAWSRYDGRDYRVVVSRLAGDAWSSPRPVGAPGSMPARLLADGEGALLLYQETAPRRWTVVRLKPRDGGGLRVANRATARSERGDPPAVALPGVGAVELDWVGEAPDDSGMIRREPSSLVLPWRADPTGAPSRRLR